MAEIQTPDPAGMVAAYGDGAGGAVQAPAVPAIELDAVEKTFRTGHGDVAAVKGIALRIAQGEFFSLLGPSGCGKTTTMRMVAGFEEPTAGRVRLYGDDVTGVPANRRDVNMVFQSYALFPHLTVFENVAFGLRRRKVAKPEIDRRVAEMIELVELSGREKHRPSQLSGGQQQRVALARALVNRPRALLLDEPLGALDLKLRQAMQGELKRIQREVGITFVYVTHDQGEALTMSDRIAVMNEGRIEQLGRPQEIYEHPATRFVAGFIGTSNLLKGEVASCEPGPDTHNAVLRPGDGEHITVPVGERMMAAGEKLELTVRPEKIAIAAGERPDADCAVRGTVTDVVYLGTTTNYTVRTVGGAEVVVFQQNALNSETAADPGDSVWLSWQARHSYPLGE